MKKLAVLFIFIFFLSPIHFVSAEEPDPIDEQSRKEELQSIYEANEQKEEAYLGAKSRHNLKRSRQASEAVQWIASDTFAYFNDVFNIKVGRGNYTWVNIEPVNGYPFVCSASFAIIQDGIQYDYVKLETASGESQCGDVYISQAYELTFWSFVDSPPDLTKEFTLIYDARFVYSLNVPSPASSVEAFVTRFYQECLGRTPGSNSLNNWVNYLLSGVKTGAEVAYGFVFSPEFLEMNATDQEYLYVLYEAFFNRGPDQAGYDRWLNELSDETPIIGQKAARNNVLNNFLGSPEFKNLCTSYGITPFPSVGGIWQGTFSSTPLSQTFSLTGIASENNKLHLISNYGAQYVGVATVSGTSVSGTFNAYAPSNYVLSDGSTIGAFSINGTIAPKQSISGTYSGLDDSGSFSLTYNYLYYRDSSLSLLAGQWLLSTINNETYNILLTVQSNGTVTGNDIHGNTYNGGFSIINSNYNAYQVDMNVTDTLGQKNVYNGLASLSDSGAQNNLLYFGATSTNTVSIAGSFLKQ